MPQFDRMWGDLCPVGQCLFLTKLWLNYMLRHMKYALNLLIVVLVVLGMGACAKGKKQSPNSSDASEIISQEGDAQGQTFSGTYLLQARVTKINSKKIDFGEEYEEGEVDPEEIECKQNGGAFSCDLDGEVVKGSINKDGSFKLAIKHDKEAFLEKEENEEMIQQFAEIDFEAFVIFEGKFTKDKKATGTFWVELRQTDGDKKGHLKMEGPFSFKPKN